MLVLDSLDFHARTNPWRPALVDIQRIITFDQLAALVHATVARIRAAGFADGPLGIATADPLLHGVLVLAAMHDGRASCSLSHGVPVPPTVRLAGCLSDRAEPLADCPHHPIGAEWLVLGGQQAPEPRRPFTSQDPVLRVLFSSGTTGLPKAVALTASNIAARLINLGTLGLPESRADCALLLMTLATSYATHQFLLRVTAGATQAFARNDQETLSVLQAQRVDLMAGSPQQLRNVADRAEALGLRLPHLRHAVVGGAPLSRAEAMHIRARLCTSLAERYGSTEMGQIAERPPGITDAAEGFLGQPFPWVLLEVVDPAGRPVPRGTPGRLRARSNSMVPGYIGDPGATSLAFGQGWFYPGDTAVLLPDGRLHVLGRESEMINAGGVKSSPTPIRDFIAAQPGVRDVAVMGMDLPGRPTEIWAAIEVAEGLDLAALDRACRATLADRAPARLVPVASLPRNANGKVELATLRTRLAAS